MAQDIATIAGSEFARKQRELFTLVKELRALGAGSHMGTPEIVVIGGQSAGKSSLVEAVTGINVPRDSGTCTRCPMECTIETSDDNTWGCNISLRRSEYDPQGEPMDGTTNEEAFSPPLRSKDDVELWLRRAQTAILNPDLSPATFKHMGYEELKDFSDPQMLKFSKDVVVVGIQDPDGMALSFVDVPGLIQNEDLHVIELVKTLVQEKIRPANTIILVTIPASDDIENQQAVLLAREADPAGQRTIGVVTKPDTLTAGAIGARKKWLRVLQGHEHPLKLGYYTVKLPDDDERAKKLSRPELKKRAWKFFTNTEPWKDLLQSRRLGIPDLISDLSILLMRIMREAIPALRKEVDDRLAECVRQMHELPEEMCADASSEILGRISSFCADLQGEVYGRNENKSFVHRSRTTFKTFELDIQESAPDFSPALESYDEYPAREACEVSEPRTISDGLYTELSRRTIIHLDPLDVRAVRSVIEESTGWELPHNIPYEAKVRLIKRSTSLWKGPSHTCFSRISDILTATVNELIKKHFGQFPQLEQHVGSIIRNEIVEFAKHARCALSDVLEREEPPYLTQNNDYFESERRNWLTRYGTEYGRIRISVTPMRTQADGYEDELMVMADVRAYFQVAYKRIIDHVPMTIQRDLCQLAADGIQKSLVTNLRLTDSDSSQKLNDLLAEDPVVMANRERLAKNKKQLESIKAKLDSFMQ
ncbi:hypothetical protein WOLCODRAFT_145375 [Wolfiporia cocos MD-104 SS10]|uniref:P-loop containing nucleoside triphosphate hydrolase protein n=1 Tax=Wolfiporia cocos (strain MD-104) TaxID=742152 RepID=A0A2H3JA67_WOLCO|nr:hypothetical protein WOLCODRAFT_145375 [Wolfiporia cocos MD-104 SS10]